MTRAFSLATFCLVIPVLLASHVWADNAPDSLSLIVSANTRFSFKTFQSLFTEDKNVLLAPTGLSLSFALLDNGADTETQKQIENTFEFTGLNRQQLNDGFSGLRRALQLDPPKDKRPSWMTPAQWRQVQSTPPYGAVIADSIWFNRSTSFPPTFLQINRRHYGMDIKRFLPTPGASIQISRWARERTKKRVSIDLTKTAARSSFILVDVTHFHAFWDNHFQESATRPGPFTLPSGQKKQVFLMYDKREFRYFETPRFQAITLPYIGFNRMYVFLPSEDSSLAEFARDLTAENWQKWSTRFRSRPGQVGLPRFKVESQFDVRSTLKSMGLQRAFESFAAFSPLAPQGAKLVSASQSTSLSVDERGTEAISVGWSAGVVGGVPGGQLAPPPTPFEMIVDRPFFFAIVNQPTGQILFMGSVVDP